MDASQLFASAGAALLGVLTAALVSLIPGLHIYNVIAFTMLLVLGAADTFKTVDPLVLTCFMLGNVVAFSVLFSVSSQYFQPCDDTLRSLMMPHERFLMEGRAHEAVLLGGIGSLIGLYACALGLPALRESVLTFRTLVMPHFHWILGAVIAFLLMTEWPKDLGLGRAPWRRFFDGWAQLLAGYFTFALAALLGLVLFSKTLLPLEAAFQSLMPVFVGLFAVSSQVLTLVSRVRVPPQFAAASIEVAPHDIFKGAASGLLAGAFSGLTPGMTPGPALLMSGHMTATTGDRQFIIGGGVARVIYYVGALFLFFLPGLHMRRGGAAINVSLLFVPETDQQFYLVGGIIAMTGAVALLGLPVFSRFCGWLASRVSFKAISGVGLAILVAIVAGVTGWAGLFLLAVSTVLGILPNLWDTRRVNLLAVLLVPICLNMAGVGNKVVRWLGIL
ncbi:MAG: tripartite tricarboxylate transporter permease [Planctomycetes bacterium]|nr:tripartite tricarboxylate transporter permease [Planctomycetota bacterium]